MKAAKLLLCDAIINLVLGVLLVVFPGSLVVALGIPPAEIAFYPSLLGAVLFGIGVALLVERFRGSSGLGLCGVISINLSGGLVLSAGLIFGSLYLPADRFFRWTTRGEGNRNKKAKMEVGAMRYWVVGSGGPGFASEAEAVEILKSVVLPSLKSLTRKRESFDELFRARFM